MGKIIGIDISKQTFDIAFLEKDKWQHQVFKNEEKGFKALIKLLDQGDCVVMEASGSYYQRLATSIYNAGYQVSVVNPLIIRWYSQTRLYRAKTDKKDAQTIAEYGKQYELKYWEASSQENIDIKQYHTALELLNKQIHQSKMQLEAFESTGSLSKPLERDLKKIIKELEKSKTTLEKKIRAITHKEYGETIKMLLKIPGVGIKTATMMCAITENFTKFENHKQLTAYVGFSPRIFTSGTSVKGKGHICKMGKGQMRKLLYLCSWSAKRVNKTCIEMYERLKEKGKPERVIKVAIANKLIKQIFAIGKNKTDYSENYSEMICF